MTGELSTTQWQLSSPLAPGFAEGLRGVGGSCALGKEQEGNSEMIPEATSRDAFLLLVASC